MIAKYTKEELLSMQHSHVVNVVLELQKQIFETKKLEKNSENSSIPPSKNPLSHKKPKNTTREVSGKKKGGQVGHIGTTRPYEEPTKVVDIKPTLENAIGSSISYRLVSKHDVVDVEITKSVTRYNVYEAVVDGRVFSANIPCYLNGNKQFGPKLGSFISYLNVYQKLPYKRITDLCHDILGVSVSEGSVQNMLDAMGKKTTALYAEIKTGLQQSEYVGSDETGNSIGGKKGWIWIWQNNNWNYYHASMNRGYKSVQEGFGEIFKGVLGHDCYGAQNQTKSGAHQLCGAHLKRDLKYCVEEGMGFGHISFKILRLLYRSRKAQKRLIDGSIKMIYKEKIRGYYEKKMRELCLLCESATGKIRKIAKRIIKHMDKMFVFLEKLFVPGHNNGSERGLRMQKIHEKVSGGFRILDGAKNYCKILSVIESLKKQGKNVIDSLYQIYINSFSRSLGSE